MDRKPVSDVMVTNFLAQAADRAKRAKKPLGQETLAMYRAALADWAVKQGTPLPALPITSRLLLGAAKDNPAKKQAKPPVWDLDLVTKHVLTNRADNSKLSDSELLGKAVFPWKLTDFESGTPRP